MFANDQYQLLDFGDSRKLERFGEFILDRPCPAAEGVGPAGSDLWSEADAVFERDESDGRSQKGQWFCEESIPLEWLLRHDQVTFELKLTPHGHVGLFVEQAANWDWIAQQVRTIVLNRPTTPPTTQLRVLNLFAYTGGSTLTAAAAGAAVTHIDSAKNIVTWARRNAELSELADRPVRWIAEDAAKFVKRELKRGNFYDAIVLDPPSYGHGPKGEVWQINQHLPPLLKSCAKLVRGRPTFMLLTCHSPSWDATALRQLLIDCFPNIQTHQISSGKLTISSTAGNKLQSGDYVRFSTTASRS